MNRKGFTLIELIAVIVVLSLIALVVFPAVNSVIKNSKEKAYKQQIATIIKATKQLSYEHSQSLPDEVDGASTEIELRCLTEGCIYNGVQINGGYINEDELIDPRNTSKNLNGVVVITYHSNQYNYEYKEQASKNTTGSWLLENDSAKAILKANNNTYKGANASNYINFSGSTWRILKINSDNTITIVKNTPANSLAYDSKAVVDFEKATINNYLNNTYYNSLSQKSYIKPTTKCIGEGNHPCEKTYTANVGLLTTEEYVNASNDQNCNLSNPNSCQNGNFLSNDSQEYTMNYSGNQVVGINNGNLTLVNANTVLNIRPVVTLKNTTKITGGNGSSTNPYLIG